VLSTDIIVLPTEFLLLSLRLLASHHLVLTEDVRSTEDVRQLVVVCLSALFDE
jgi:hypothetical protein